MLRPYYIMKKRIVYRPTIVIHGGCGRRPPTKKQLSILSQALEEGYALLQNGAPALDGVEAAVVLLEKSGHFNAGCGSKRQMDGVIRMDASIMDGRDLSAGAVAAMEAVLTPISAARCVMKETSHVMLAGQAARNFGVEPFPPSLRRKQPEKLSGIPTRWRQLSKRLPKLGTVGAVARDRYGHLAAGTSTGGFSLMLPGRVGDSPLIGAGTYADDRSGAVSMTGDGEAIIRAGLAKEICLLMEQGLSPLAAGRKALRRMRKRTNGHAGAIIASATGRFAIVHTTTYMIAGYRSGQKKLINNRFRRA